MKQLTILIIIIISILNINAAAQVSAGDFIAEKQVKQLYEMIISEIEYIDAEAIDVRNRTKDVSWEAYKQHHKNEFTKVNDYNALREKFTAFGDGFVSGHSDFEFLYPINETPKQAVEANIKLGYTYPKITFFDLETKKIVIMLDNQPVKKIFNTFKNFQTATNTINDCQRAFTIQLEKGDLLVDGVRPTKMTLEDGSVQQIVYNTIANRPSRLEQLKSAIVIDDKYANWEKIEVGYKIAVLKQDDVALVKIRDFIYFNGSGGELNCAEAAPDSTHCGDIQKIRAGLAKISADVKYLIIDLQGNPGGQENSRFLAELCPKPFYDLRVQYKKTPLLLDDELRAHLFYNSDRAEKWFQEIMANGVYENTADGDFLPARADFCQGAENCALLPIEPNTSAKRDFEKIVILVNEETASSADDFTYRMKSHAQALVAGQPQSADLTYSLVSVVFYVDENNEIQKRYLGNRQYNYDVIGSELIRFSIPYSKTVDENGKRLQGNPAALDMEIALTKKNFENREVVVLNSVVEELQSQ